MSAEGTPYLPPIGSDGLRHWQVAGGVIIKDGAVLLVKNVRSGGRTDWSTPGGVVDPGETAVDGLTREVREETGLQVLSWDGPLYHVEVHAPDAGFFLRVEAHLASSVEGEIVIDDPDGIVVEVDFVARPKVASRLGDAQPWVVEPLLAHLHDGVSDGRLFSYRMTGGKDEKREIVRL